MSRIKIKNFGPIHEGFLENDGWMDIEKVTVLIGDQGSGKSTVAKLISIFSWIEKSIVKSRISTKQLNYVVFKNLCIQQEISEYFTPTTVIFYEGLAYNFEYFEKKKSFIARKTDNEKYNNYILPKIQYVSAARNLLTILYNVSMEYIHDKNGNIIDLSANIPFMVKDLNKEYMKALEKLAKNGYSLPLNETSVYYQNHSTFIKAKGKAISMSAASSGIQSITPLLLVSHFLSEEVTTDILDKVQYIDDNQKKQIENNFAKGNADLVEKYKQLCNFGKGILTEEDGLMLTSKLRSYIPSSFINIVEEPEQNLFPTSQQKVINSLLEYNNDVKDNKLIVTTHSPYIINYLMLAIKAFEIEKKAKKNKEIKSKIYNIVPEKAITPLQNVVIYELNERNGTITRLGHSLGLPSNEHYLNNLLGETNMLFSNLMEIEDLCEE